MKANLSTTFKTRNESAWSVIVILPIHINLQWGWLLLFFIRNKFLLAASTMVIKCLWPLVLCGCGSTDALGERRKMGCGDRLCCWRLNHNDLHLFRGRRSTTHVPSCSGLTCQKSRFGCSRLHPDVAIPFRVPSLGNILDFHRFIPSYPFLDFSSVLLAHPSFGLINAWKFGVARELYPLQKVILLNLRENHQ